MNSFNILSKTLVLTLLLGACAVPPDKEEHAQKPLSAAELAAAEIRQITGTQEAVPSAPPLHTETSTSAPSSPLPQVNQSGSLPAMHRISEGGLKPLEQYFPPGEAVQLDYEQVELRQVLEELADILGISLVIDSSIAAKVTVRTAPDKPLAPADVWPTLQLLLADNGISMEKKGNVYHLKRQVDLLPTEIGGVDSGLVRSNAPEVMQVTPLRYISVDTGMTALRPLVEPQGRMVSLPTLNLLGIISSPRRLRRVNNLLNLIDADPFVHRGMRLFRLNNAKASEIQEELDKILKAVEGNAPAYQIIGLERINSILVIGPPRRGFKEVERWVEILDEKNEEGGEQIFIYRVRNLKAGTLASTLSEIFKTEQDEDEAPRRNAQQGTPPAQPPDSPQQAVQQAQRRRESGVDGGVSAKLKVNIVADEDTNTLLIRAQPRDYRQLLDTIAVLDQVPREVMVNVVVAEVKLTENTRFGIEWAALLGNRSFMGTAYGIRGQSSGSGHEFAPKDLSGLVINQVGNRISSILQLIATDNDVNVLSRPSILVRNNQEATMNVGNEEPTITRVNTTTSALGQIDNTNNFTTSNEVQYRQTGIILKVTPHINEDGIINMEVSQEVSGLNKGGTTIESLPSFNQRKFETSLLVRDGSAIVLGGLIETRTDNSLEGIPGLMRLPLIGPLFSTQGKGMERTELVVIIVPEIIDPTADNSAYVKAFQERMKAVSSLLNEDPTPLFTKEILYQPTPVAPVGTKREE